MRHKDDKKVTRIVESLLWIAIYFMTAVCILYPAIPSAKAESDAETTGYSCCQEDTEEIVFIIPTLEPETAVIEETEETTADYKSAWCERVSMDFDGADAYLLARIAYCEAGNQGVVGMAAVIQVVLNRVWDPKYPNTIEEVIYAPKQFAAVNGAHWNDELPLSAWQALDLVTMKDPEGLMPEWIYEAQFFCVGGESEWHKRALHELGQIGAHTFYRVKEAKDEV